jgi:hypothetical protein
VLIASVLPVVALAPLVGRLVDRIDSRVLLTTVGLGQAALARTEMSWSSYGGDPEKVAVIEEALEVLPEGEDSLRAKLLSLLGNDLAFLDAERHERLADEAVAAARRSGDSRAIDLCCLSWPRSRLALSVFRRRRRFREQRYAD